MAKNKLYEEIQKLSKEQAFRELEAEFIKNKDFESLDGLRILKQAEVNLQLQEEEKVNESINN